MKRSRYTLLIDDFPQKGTHLFFNTMTQDFIEIDDAVKHTIENLPDKPGTVTARRAIRKLRRMRFVVPDEDTDSKNMETWFSELKEDNREVQATVLTTYGCNFACPYCVEESVKAPVHMSDETAMRTVEYIQNTVTNLKAKRIFLNFYGGEPLVNMKVIRTVATKIRDFAVEKGLQYACGMTTNGALLTPETVDELIPLGLRGVKITLDGDRDHHDKTRPYVNGKGSFDVIIKNLLYACEKIDVNVGGNFNAENVGSFPLLLDYLKSLGLEDKLNKVSFKPISQTVSNRSGVKPGIDLGCVYADPSTAETMVSLRNEIVERGFPTDPSVGVNMCGMTTNSALFAVDPLGTIYKCPALVGHEEFSAGSVFDDSDAQSGSEEERWRRCLECAYVPLCGDGCMYGSYVRYGDAGQLNCQKEYVEYVVRNNLIADYRRLQES